MNSRECHNKNIASLGIGGGSRCVSKIAQDKDLRSKRRGQRGGPRKKAAGLK